METFMPVVPPIERAVQERIDIQMLGEFSISHKDLSIGDHSNRMHQLWNLLEYLVAFRRKTITQEELISMLWAYDDSENPANALKNLIYRIRTTFAKEGFPFAKQMILYQRGSYSWNNDLPCTVDVEVFENLVQEGRQADKPQRKISLYTQAIFLYKGDLLPGSRYEEWVVPLAAHYRTLYYECVYEVAELLLAQNAFEKAQEICEKAIAIDPFEERAHRYLIFSLIRQNLHSQALEHYRSVTELFYKELGVRPTEALRTLYQEIIKNINPIETDLNTIEDDLRERSAVEGAFYCEYEIFKSLYRVEARAASRSGESIFLGLLTVTDSNNLPPTIKALGTIMDHLLDSIRYSLRKGDVISRFSSTQYVLMLPTVSYEHGQMVLERICKRFRQDFRGKSYKIHRTLQPMTPVEVPSNQENNRSEVKVNE